ncbi:MAG: MFS transporter [Actinobacteria bacterium]|nr:MFS transporter [Actinomycetota bacterium]
MPHVRRRVLVRVNAAPDEVRAAAIRELHISASADGTLVGPLFDHDSPGSEIRIRVEAAPDGSAVELDGGSDISVPYFGWVVRLIVWFVARRVLLDFGTRLQAAATGAPVPPPRHHRTLVPTSFTADQAKRLAALAAVGTIASFGSALFTQNGDAVTTAFDRSDQALTDALALARLGVLVTLVTASSADRFGRRRMILVGLAGMCIANAAAALAPSFEVFTVSQILTRAFANATFAITALAVVEEAPEGGRAFAFSIFGLGLGLGFGCTVFLLPINDLSEDTWRVAFAMSALTIALLPSIARNVRETERFQRIAVARKSVRARLLEPFDRQYGGRFLVLGAVVFLVNIFSAPSSQLTNRYLTHTHDFSNSEVALLRGVTAGVPGVVGVLVAGQLAESRGRRIVIITGLLVATAFQVTFFVGAGALLWIMPTVSIVAASCAGIGLGTTNNELFPTEARGTSSGFLLVSGVAGAAIGLLLASRLKDVAGGLGPAIALLGVAPLIAAALLTAKLPETRARRLDDISPSEI